MVESKLQILLVEDDDDHAEIVARSLATKPMNAMLHHVSDGEMALDFLFRRGRYEDTGLSPRPHMILLDLRLPKVDGCEVLRTVKASPELRSIPVVILTTSAAERDVALAYGNHANSYLVKPVVFEEFSEMMRVLGLYWLALNHHPVTASLAGGPLAA
jgi:CheY-like chemotaxis protein